MVKFDPDLGKEFSDREASRTEHKLEWGSLLRPFMSSSHLCVLFPLAGMQDRDHPHPSPLH